MNNVHNSYEAWRFRRHKIFVRIPRIFRNHVNKVPYYTPKILPPGYFFHGEKIYFELRPFFCGSAVYALTNMRIIKRSGWIKISYFECALEKIINVQAKPCPWLKNCGNLEFSIKDYSIRKLDWAGIRNLDHVCTLTLLAIKENSKK